MSLSLLKRRLELDLRGGYRKGGGSGQAYYENQDKLLGVQADIATNMYNQYATKGAPLLASLSDKASGGVDPEKYAGQAAADAQNANANERDTTIRNMERSGVNPASGNFQALTADNTLRAAANTAGAQNSARRDAEKLDWAHKSDVAAMYSGMPGQATQSLASAAGGYGQMAGQQNQTAMANAQGYGAMGATLGKAIMAKDGGMIRKTPVAEKVGLCFAAGGMPTLGDWRQRPTSIQKGAEQSPLGSLISGAAPTVGMELAKPYLKEAFAPIKNGISNAMSSITNPIKEKIGEHILENSAPDAAAQLTGEEMTKVVAEKAAADGVATAGAEGAETAIGSEAAETGAALAADSGLVGTGAELGFGAMLAETGAAGALAGGATAAAGGASAALGTVAAANAWNPLGWGLGALALIGLADGFADGGEVNGRKDMRGGGPVSGPGTTTSDDIPAWLSDKEYVLNAEATAMIGKEELDALNAKGLAMREKSGDESGKPDGAPQFFLGGMAGVAMGAGVKQWNEMEQQDLQKKASQRADQALVLQQQQAQRQGDEHAWRAKEQQGKDKTQATLEDINARQTAAANPDTYINQQQDEAKAAAGINGIDYSPMSDEQKSVIRQARGSRLNPVDQYHFAIERGNAFAATDPKMQNALHDKATQDASGHAYNALMSGDSKTFGDFYRIFPNGDNPQNITIDKDKKNVIFEHADGRSATVPVRDVALGLASRMNPMEATKLGIAAERSDEQLARKDATIAEQQRGGGAGGGDSRKDAAAIFGEAQKIVTGEDGKTDGERLGPINAMAQNLYRAGQATSPGEAVMLAKDRLANAEFSPNRATARAQQDLEQIKKTQNVTGGLNPTGNSWADVSKQLTGKSVSEEQFVKDRAQGYINNGRSAPAPAQGQPAAKSLPPDGTKGTDAEGNRFEMRGGKAVPIGQAAAAPVAAPAPVAVSKPRDGRNIFGISGGINSAVNKSNSVNEDKAMKYTAALLNGSMSPVNAKEILKNVEKNPSLIEKLSLTSEKIDNLRQIADR